MKLCELLDKLDELSKSLKNMSETALNVCKAVFFLSAASTFIYSSIHLHHILPLVQLYAEAMKGLIRGSLGQ